MLCLLGIVTISTITEHEILAKLKGMIIYDCASHLLVAKAPMKLKSTPSLSSMKTLLQGTSTALDTEHTLSSTTLYEPTCSSFETENPLTEREFAKTQESTGLCSTQPTFCHDPSVLEESPSMVAFSLSTPTKDDPVSFENALKRL